MSATLKVTHPDGKVETWTFRTVEEAQSNADDMQARWDTADVRETAFEIQDLGTFPSHWLKKSHGHYFVLDHGTWHRIPAALYRKFLSEAKS